LKTKAERIEDLKEWFYIASHGKVGIGWGGPNHPWGLITSFDVMHKKLEEIMDPPVWTSEMAESNSENLVKELEKEDKGFSFYNEMKSFGDKLIIVTHDETGESLQKLKTKVSTEEPAKK